MSRRWTKAKYESCAKDLVATYGKQQAASAEFLEEYYQLFESSPPNLDTLQDAVMAVEVAS